MRTLSASACPQQELRPRSDLSERCKVFAIEASRQSYQAGSASAGRVFLQADVACASLIILERCFEPAAGMLYIWDDKFS